MKKIIPLLLTIAFVSTMNAQRKIEVPKPLPVRFEYVEMQQILDHKTELQLTDIQAQSLIIKNEYIKRDMSDLNDKTNINRIEKRKYLEDLEKSYALFIERQLTSGQLEKWDQMKRKAAAENEITSTFKEDLVILREHYAIELKDLELKYAADKKMFVKQKKHLSRYYNTKANKILQYYKEKAITSENGEEEKVLTLEEIADLVKEFENHTTGNDNSINRININEETQSQYEEEESTTE